jgi:hypothetical protein
MNCSALRTAGYDDVAKIRVGADNRFLPGEVANRNAGQ